MEQRKSGFYWVKYKGHWEIAEWIVTDLKSDPCWFELCGSDHSLRDKDFEEIDETTLTRQIINKI